jgi:hypothetical protein
MNANVRWEERRSRRFARGAAAAALAAAGLGLFSPCAMGQTAGQPGGGEKVTGARAVLLLERSALEKMVVDPRDEGLARAVAMLPARIRELPGEVPGLARIPPPALDLALAILSNPGRLGVTYNADDKLGGAFGVGLVASVLTSDEVQAQSMHGVVSAFLATAGEELRTEPSKAFPSMTEIRGIPVGKLVRVGPRRAADGWRYEVHAGSAGHPEEMFASLPRPVREGFEPVLRARLDLSALTPLAEELRAMAGADPEADRGFEAMERAGLFGAEGMRYSYQFGYLPDRSLGYSVTEGIRRRAAAMGIESTPLAADDLRSVPADAYWAGLRRIDLGPVVELLRGMSESQPEAGQGLRRFTEATGVDLLTDVLGSLGGTVGWYMSDTTGGLGLMSAVALVQFKDRARFDTASAKLAAFANAALAGPSRGYFRVRQWTEGDARMATLTFPGLPVPIELTYTTTERFLILAMSPQAALAAARQATGHGDGGLMANAAFASVLPKGRELESVGFTDVGRTMSAGYQFVSLFGSALANMARSPRDPGREPGLIVPPLNELKRDARARVDFGYWDGDNLVHETHGNRSLLVEACGSAGAASPFVPVIVAAAAAAGAGAQQERMQVPVP